MLINISMKFDSIKHLIHASHLQNVKTNSMLNSVGLHLNITKLALHTFCPITYSSNLLSFAILCLALSLGLSQTKNYRSETLIIAIITVVTIGITDNLICPLIHVFNIVSLFLFSYTIIAEPNLFVEDYI